MRKAHPAFRMISGDQVRKHLTFEKAEDGVVSYVIKDHANGDKWKNILVVYNAQEKAINYEVEGSWTIAVKGDDFYPNQSVEVNESVEIPAISMFVAYQK